jgi:Peptidase family M28
MYYRREQKVGTQMKEAQKLLQMLTYKRPAGGKSEETFLKRYVLPFKPLVISTNLIVQVVGDEETLFSCHTDTVHRESGTQVVLFDDNLKLAYKTDKEPLGADDTTGVWLLLEMIKAKIPGIYAFHYGEERGCIGSKQMAREHPELFAKIKRAIAFDRRGTTSIITHQMSQRCCSDTFADAVASALGHDYKKDSTGLYTDTASYTGLVPECTNISVGYEHQHCAEESQDISFALEMREWVLAADWKSLPTERDPKAKPHYRATPTYYSGHCSGGRGARKVWDSQRNRLSSISEMMFDDRAVEDVAKMANDEIEELNDARELIGSEPALAARMLYALVMKVQDYRLRERRPKKDALLPAIIQAGATGAAQGVIPFVKKDPESSDAVT